MTVLVYSSHCCQYIKQQQQRACLAAAAAAAAVEPHNGFYPASQRITSIPHCNFYSYALSTVTDLVFLAFFLSLSSRDCNTWTSRRALCMLTYCCALAAPAAAVAYAWLQHGAFQQHWVHPYVIWSSTTPLSVTVLYVLDPTHRLSSAWRGRYSKALSISTPWIPQ